MATTGGGAAALVAAAVAVVVVTMITRLCAVMVFRLLWRPYAVARSFARQGVHGPPYRLLVGNSREVQAMRAAASAGATLDPTSHDYIPRVMPHYHAWVSVYGKVFLTWTGSTPTLFVGSYDMAKRVLLDRSGLYGKTDPGPAIRSFIGRTGLPLLADGDADWARHRRVVRPAFATDKLRHPTTTGTMVACAAQLVRAWEARCAVAATGETVTVEVGQGLRELTADVIARTAFGRRYHDDDRLVKDVFLLQRELQLIAVASISSSNDSVLWQLVPGMMQYYLPTRANLRRWRLERTLRRKIRAIIDERLAAVSAAPAKEEEAERCCYGSDLLGLMLAAAADNAGGDDDDGKRHVMMSMEEIIDECQTFFFAGHDTTSHLITWAMFLLATHPEWQERLRDEVLRECGGIEQIDADALNKLKLVTMVLYETLRLYGGVTLIARQATADDVTDLCGVEVPRGTVLVIPIAMLHRDEEAWGADAGAFDPLRFRRDGGGVGGRAANAAAALLSFSLGPRACLGQGFAMMEARATLALVLRRFEFQVAPEYVHAPVDLLTLQPSQGLPLVLKLLDRSV